MSPVLVTKDHRDYAFPVGRKLKEANIYAVGMA